MSRSSAANEVVGCSRDISSLLPRHGGMAPEEAISRGLLVRQKVEGVWLYARDKSVFNSAADAVTKMGNDICNEWLLARLPILTASVAKNIHKPRVTRQAAQYLLHSALRAGDLIAMGLLTQEDQPYLAVYAKPDEEEIGLQLTSLEELLRTNGCAKGTDLPDPAVPRALRVWRETLLHHGEFLGLGQVIDGQLIAWGYI